MTTNTFTYRVVFNLYASARKNILPKPGTISLDDAGILTLTDTSNQQIVVQKRFVELAGVRPGQYMPVTKYATGPHELILYVSHNEAYKVAFVSEDPIGNGVGIYEKDLQGDMAGGREALKEFYSQPKGDSELTASIQEANGYYTNFIAVAKQAGIYRSVYTSTSFVGGVLMTLALIAFFILLFRGFNI